MKNNALMRFTSIAGVACFAAATAAFAATTANDVTDLRRELASAHAKAKVRLEQARRDNAGWLTNPRLAEKHDKAVRDLDVRHQRLVEALDLGGRETDPMSVARQLAAIRSQVAGLPPTVGAEPAAAPLEKASRPTSLAFTKSYPPVVPADLAPSLDAPITPEIQALANTLGKNPVAIYNWIRTNIGYVPGVGSTQGAAGALATRAANAADTASLLIALYRASNIPARYVTGRIEIDVARLRTWLGGVPTTQAALELLSQGGVGHEVVTQGGDITAVRMDHVWVHAWIDTVVSRGGANRQGDFWIELDAAYKAYRVNDGRDLTAYAQLANPAAAAASIAGAATVDSAQGVISRLEGAAVQAELAATRTRIEQAMATAGLTNATLGDLIGTWVIEAPAWSLLPLSLPVKTIAQDAPVAVLADASRQKVAIRIFRTELDRLQGTALLSAELPLAQIAGQVISLRYVPATLEDANVLVNALPTSISTPASLPKTIPGYLIDVRAQLWLGATMLAESSAPVTLGESMPASVKRTGLGTDADELVFSSVAGEVRAITWDLAGNLASAFEALGSRLRTTRAAANPGIEALAVDPLAALAAGYFATHDLYSTLSSGVNLTRHYRLPSFGSAATWLESELNLGIPTTVHFSGIQVSEAIHRQAVAAGKPTADVARYRWQSLNLASTLAHTLPEFVGAREGVSAIKTLAAALANQSPVVSVTAETRARLATLGLDTDLRTRLESAVNAGRRVSVNGADVALPDWTGRAAMIEDTARQGTSPARGGTIQTQYTQGGSRAEIGVALAWASLLPDAARSRLAALQPELTDPFISLSDSLRIVAGNPLVQRASPQTLAVLAGHVFDRAVGPVVSPLVDHHLWAGLLLPHVRVNLLSEAQAPTVGITLTPETVALGSSTQILVTASDNVAVTQLTLVADGAPVALTNGQASYTPARAGVISMVATARDAAGNFAEARKNLNVTDSGDTTAPTVAIATPVDGAELSGVTPVIGSASDASFSEYRVELSVADANQWTVIGSGQAPALNQQLGVFDPSTLANGLYDLRLVARDTNGRESIAKISVIVKGELKIGQFSLTFRDLEVEVSGIPITVHRTYDTRRKGEQLAFGFGWSVDYQDVKIQSNGITGQGWTLEQRGSGIDRRFCPVPVGKKMVTVRLPDGKLERFDAGVSPECKSASDIAANPDFAPAFWPREGTASSMAAIGGPLRISGNLLIDVGSGEPYNPVLYQLTTENKYVYQLNKAFGITTVADPHGNTLSYSAAGISHSAGKSVAFTRDAQGRIFHITDPDGKVIIYGYDPVGDLASVTDRESRVATHSYDGSHGLQTYTDPRGTLLMRTEYDDQGRVLKQVDADGKSIDFTRNTAARQEVVKDRRGYSTTYEYDQRGNVDRVVDARGGITLYTYDAYGYEKTKTDQNGHTTERTYDAVGKVLQEKDGLGNPTDYTYDPNHKQLKTVRDALGRVTESGYNGNGTQLTSLKDALGRTTGFGYSTTGNLTSITDAAGKITTYDYDASGNRFKEIDATGAVTTFKHDGSGRVTSWTKTRVPGTNLPPVSFTSSRVYDGNGQVIREIDPYDHVTRTEYNGLGKPEKVIDPLGRETLYEYNAKGELWKTTFPDGQYETVEYDGNGNEIFRTDARGNVVGTTYDELNRLTRITNPDGTFVTNEYDPGGRLFFTEDENGNRTTFEYDAAGRRRATINALGERTEFTYDLVGNLKTVKDPLEQVTTHDYNSLNQRIKTTFHDGKFIEPGYDTVGRKTSEKDEEGRTATYTYDNVGRLWTVSGYPSNATYAYDAVGNKVSQLDGRNSRTRWDYDHMGRVIARHLPAPHAGAVISETITYDAAGNRETYTDFGGGLFTYEYDAQNRLLFKHRPGGRTVGYTYTATGQVSSISDERGTILKSYDARERLEKVENPDGSILEYGYDYVGNRTSLKVTVGGVERTTTYGYDVLNRLSSLTDHDGRVTSWTYDAAGNRKTQTLPNGIVTTWGYDTRNRLTSIVHRAADDTLIASYVYTLYFNGQRRKVEETTASGLRTVEYTYDAAYRLESEKVTVGGTSNTVTYGYDQVGNRRSKTGGPIDSSYDGNDRLTYESAQAWLFDANGNTLTRPVTGGTANYAYDVENRLVKVTLPGTQGIVEYVYDAEGNRVETKVTQGGSTTVTRHIVDTNRAYPEVVEERDGEGLLKAAYAHGHDLEGPVSVANYVGATATPSFYLTDALGSTRFLTSSSGAATDSYLYDAFGNDAGRTGTTPNGYRFTGEQFDDLTKLTYLRARWLNNASGRFMTVDPHPGRMRDPRTLNDYVYAGANPIRGRDPSGMFTTMDVGVASFAVGMSAVAGLEVGTALYRGQGLREDSRSHYYTSDTKVCSRAETAWCTPDEVFRWMTYVPAPMYLKEDLRKRPVQNGEREYHIGGDHLFAYGGTVDFFLKPGENRIINLTVRFQHALHDGRVERQAHTKDGGVYIRTVGTGKNASAIVAFLNEIYGRQIFIGVDGYISGLVGGGRAPQ